MRKVKSTEKRLSTSSLKCLSAPPHPDFLGLAYGHVDTKQFRELTLVPCPKAWILERWGRRGNGESWVFFFFLFFLQVLKEKLHYCNKPFWACWDLRLFGLHHARLNGKYGTSPTVPSARLHGRKYESFTWRHLPHTPSQQDTDPTSWIQWPTREAPTPLA